jgi:Flp pilus assembly protein TadG
MVEFALTAPLFVLIVFGIIELGILFSVYIGLTNSAREATRAAAIYRYPGATPISTDLTAVNTVDAARLTSFTSILTSTMNPIISSEAVSVTVGYLAAPGDTYTQPTGANLPYNTSNPLRSGDTISATLQYSHQLFWGLLGPNTISLTASSVARIEPGGAQ